MCTAGDCQQNPGATLCNRMTEISKVKSHPALRSQIFQGATLLLVPPCRCRNQTSPSSAKLLGTSRPYNLHLKLMLSEQFLEFWLYASANLQILPENLLEKYSFNADECSTPSANLFVGRFGAFIATTLWFSTCPTVNGTV